MTPRLTVYESADIARCHWMTIYRALEDGTLHGEQRVKRGRWTIRPECLDAWLDNKKCEHQAASTKVTRLADRRAARASA